jgi:cytochrome P450 family 103
VTHLQQPAALTEAELPRLDIDGVEFRRDPNAALLAARGHAPIVSSRRGLEVLTHTDVRALLTDDRLVTQNAEVYRRYGAQPMLVSFAEDGLLAAMHGAKHDRIRRVFLAAFRARTVEAGRAMMRATAQQLVDQLPSDGTPTDFVAAFASPFPMQVLCRFIGIPVRDIPAFTAAATKLHLLAQTPIEPGFPEIETALQTLHDYCIELVAQRRLEPTDDAISALIQAQESNERITDDELAWNVANLIFAGQDTTRFQLASAVRFVLAEPGLWDSMHERPEQVADVAEETLRIAPVVNFVVRIVQREFDYEGVRFAKGRRVILNVQAASRDPERFDDPDSFCPRATGRHAQSFDVPFGLGDHYCLGAGLARAELQEALAALTGALTEVRLVDEPLMTAPAAMLHGPEQLTIAYRRRRA